MKHILDGGHIPIQMRWIDYLNRRVWLGDCAIYLTRKETEIILVLLLRRGCYISRTELIEFVWPNPDDEPETSHKSILTYLVRLRRKLGRKIIGSQMTRGYIIHRPR